MRCSRHGGIGAALVLCLAPTTALADISIDDFEDVSDWTGLTLEASTVHTGAGAGRWDNMVTRKSVKKTFAAPVDASSNRYVELWLFSQVANGAKIELIFDSENVADATGWDYYHHQLVIDWIGWRFLRVPLSDFDAARNPVGWQQINYVSLSADGWAHTPLPDTVLVLDSMSFATGVIGNVTETSGYVGSDYVYSYTIDLEERNGVARTLDLVLDPEPGSPSLHSVAPASVVLAANGTTQAIVEITVPASEISPATWLTLHTATLSISESGRVCDEKTLSTAVPMPGREHPRTLLDAADFTRIGLWASAEPWAAAARDQIVAAADNWPASFETKYTLASWQLPPEGGQWDLWYVCPTHGDKLRFDGPGLHVCPIDGEQHVGWPYDQVIFARMHQDLAAAARDLGLAYQLTGTLAYAQRAAEILLAYADAYLIYPIHNINGVTSKSGARVLSQTLDEAGWIIPVAWAYDLVADSGALTEPNRTHIEQDLLREAAAVIARNPAGMSNWQSWHNASIGAVGFALDDPLLIAQVIRGPDGMEYQLRASITPDGFWYEGSWTYHFFALNALYDLAEMASRAGYELWGERLCSLFAAPLLFAMPDGGLPSFNDSTSINLAARASSFELGYNRCRDERMAAPLANVTRRRDALFWGAEALPAATSLDFGSLLFPDAGYAVLRSGTGTDARYLALDYGPHGGGHGHYDKLGFVFYARDTVLGVDPGTHSYALPLHTTWDKVTLAHNTVVVDATTQAEATGQLHRFIALPALSLVAADAGLAYPNASLLRTMVLSSDYVLDRFHVRSNDAANRGFDWIYHDFGTLSTSLVLAPYAGLPATNGYQHISDVQAAQTDVDWDAAFDVNAPLPYGSTYANDTRIGRSFEYSREQTASGAWAGRISYDFSAATGYALFTAKVAESIAEVPDSLRLALYGDGSGNTLVLRVNDSTDERFSLTLGPIDWTGWKSIDLGNISTWSHYLGDADGIFDPPAASVTIELRSAAAAPPAGVLYVDNIELTFPTIGTLLVEDFEIPLKSLRLRMLGEIGTTVVTGNGLGPDLQKPVPLVIARRQTPETVFASVLEPFGAAPSITSFAALSTDAAGQDEAAAFSVTTADFHERLLALADGTGGVRRTFGDAACDGVLCIIRRATDSAPLRLVLAGGGNLEDAPGSLIYSSGSFSALQIDYVAAGTLLDIWTAVPLDRKVWVYGPLVTEVRVNGTRTEHDREGDYVLLGARHSSTAGGGSAAADPGDSGGQGEEPGALDQGQDPVARATGCACGPGESPGSALGLSILALGVLAWRRRR